MEKPKANQLAYWTGVIMASLFIGFLIQFARAWTDPSANPPGGNLGAPVNTSALGQVKAGTLGVNSNAWIGGTIVGANTGLTVGGKAQADDFCLNSDNTKCLSGGGGGRIPPPDFETNWVAVSASKSGTITHNLGVSQFSLFQILVRENATRNDVRIYDGMTACRAAFTQAASYEYGIDFRIPNDSTTQVIWNTGYTQPCFILHGGEGNWSSDRPASVEMKIRIWR